MPVDLSTLAKPPAPPPSAKETAQAECRHTNLQPEFNIQVLRDEQDPKVQLGMLAILRLVCTQCELPFKWLGLDTGQSFSRPMVSEDGTAMLAPCVPGNETVAAMAPLPELRQLSDGQRDAMTAEILAALMTPESFTPKMLAETRTEHRARAIFAALERMV